MKNHTILILLFFSAAIFSQKEVDSLHNFKITEGSLIWQKVYKSPNINSKNDFKTSVLTKIKSSNLKETEDNISFSIEKETINFVKYGGSAMFTAFFLQDINNYFVSCDFKDNKYRITVSNITSGSTEKNESLNLERYILTKGKIKNNKFNQKNLLIYQNYFDELFTINNSQKGW
jgi:hypothetical protein